MVVPPELREARRHFAEDGSAHISYWRLGGYPAQDYRRPRLKRSLSKQAFPRRGENLTDTAPSNRLLFLSVMFSASAVRRLAGRLRQVAGAFGGGEPSATLVFGEEE